VLNSRIFAIVFVLLVAIPFLTQAFGHGLSIDTPPPVYYQGHDISVTAEMLPSFYDDKLIDKQIKVRAFDSKTGENMKNVNFLIGLNYKDEMVFRNYFFAENGDLKIKVYPSSDGEIEISGEKEPLLGGWMSTDEKPIELRGPVFNSGGLYRLEIELRTIEKPDNLLDETIKYDAYISIGNTSYHAQKTMDGQDVKFRVRSYYDTIANFEYNPDGKVASFEMPFDWSEQNISQIPYVHEELLFPKHFVEFLAPSYKGQVNGIDLFRSSITIDDYSVEDGRIVHFLLVQDQLKVLRDQQKKSGDLPDHMKFKLIANDEIKFPFVASTNDQRFQVDLSWDPPVIQTGEKIKFIFTIRDSVTLETKQHSTYDFVILSNGREIHRTSGNAVIGGAFEEFTFTEEQTGPIIIRFEKIAGTSASTQFALVVVPEFGLYATMILLLATSFIIIFRIHKFSLN
jgi:predicted secreted protein with PEFG-CTERM motif